MPITSNAAPILAIIGPSGVGKSAIASQLVKRGVADITPSVTDRPRRAGEPEIEHRFVSQAEFDRLLAKNYFVGEIVTPFGLPYRYGLPLIEDKGNIPLVMTRAYFIPVLRRYYPNTIVYQIEAAEDFAAGHIQRRQDENIGTRLSKFKEEIELGRSQTARVFLNYGNNLEELVNKIAVMLKQDFKP